MLAAILTGHANNIDDLAFSALVSGSAIKRITAGVKARRDRRCQDSIIWSGLHLPD